MSLKNDIKNLFKNFCSFRGHSVLLSISKTVLTDPTDLGNTNYIDGKPVEVIISPEIESLDTLIGTLVHEHLHVRYPKLSHDELNKREAAISGALTPEQKAKLLGMFFNRVWIRHE